jgi:hypothetical protein
MTLAFPLGIWIDQKQFEAAFELFKTGLSLFWHFAIDIRNGFQIQLLCHTLHRNVGQDGIFR